MTLSRNLLAALANSILTTLVGLAVVPLYLEYLGIEAYGLIGFFATLQAVLQILDLGLAPTVNREVARFRAAGDARSAGRLVHTLAGFYWWTAVAIAAALALAAPAISDHWLQARRIPRESVTSAVMLMGFIIACRWPAGLYLGALMGAERLTVASALGVASAVAGNVGAIAVLAFVRPTIQAFFAWQAFVGLGYALASRWAAWRVIGRDPGLRFDSGELKRVWRFSATVGGIAVVGLVIMQLDKVVLSRLLGLEDFGRYMLAATVGGGLYLLIMPLFNGVYPRFSALVASGDTDGLAALYGTSTRLLGTGVFPVAALLAMGGEDIMRVWTGDAALAHAVAPLVTVLAAGTALHGVMYLPHALQLAYGETRLALGIGIALLAVFLPLMLVLAPAYGALGGAFAWLALHVLYLLGGTWLTHRYLLKGRGIAWLLREVGVPLGISLAVAVPGRIVLGAVAWPGLAKVTCSAALALVASAASFAASPQLTRAVLENLGWRSSARRPDGAELPRTGTT